MYNAMKNKAIVWNFLQIKEAKVSYFTVTCKY